MTKRILLSEMPVVVNELIQLEQLKYNNGQTILKMLNRLGLELTKVDNWQAIEQEFTKDYPKATLQFNLQANGVEPQFLEAEAFYFKNRYVMTFEAVTPEQIQEIKDNCKVWADQPNQIEAHDLITTIVESLNRLLELGVKLDPNHVYHFSRLIYGDSREQPPFKVDQKLLVSTLVNMK